MPKSSTGSDQHPYLKTAFWIREENQFWRSKLYSEKSKDYFNASVENMVKNERREYTLNDKPL